MADNIKFFTNLFFKIMEYIREANNVSQAILSI